MAASLKNIIFDLGGVILNIDYHATIRAFEALGIERFEAFYSQQQQNSLFDDLETGAIGPKAFHDRIREHLPGCPDQTIDDAWNAMLLDLPAHRLDFLRTIGHQYRIFLLSNTNSIHYEAYAADLQRAHELDSLSGLFERAYYSFEVGLRKPDAAIFQLVLDENGLNPGETLFIDDSIQHIHGADSLGIRTLHLVDDDIATAVPAFITGSPGTTR